MTSNVLLTVKCFEKMFCSPDENHKHHQENVTMETIKSSFRSHGLTFMVWTSFWSATSLSITFLEQVIDHVDPVSRMNRWKISSSFTLFNNILKPISLLWVTNIEWNWYWVALVHKRFIWGCHKSPTGFWCLQLSGTDSGGFSYRDTMGSSLIKAI